MSPFTLTAPNDDSFCCKVETAALESIIWSCHVTSTNINLFRAKKKSNELQLGGLHHVVLGILQ
ncbi:hypothetical protein JM18_006251, partial [Phytophthora kernoviae]